MLVCPSCLLCHAYLWEELQLAVELAAYKYAFGYRGDGISTKAFLSEHLVLNSLVAFHLGQVESACAPAPETRM